MSFIAGYLLGMGQGGNKAIQPLSVTKNGSYEVPEGVDGYNPVNVNVPSGAVTEGLSVTSNGTYTPPSGVDGFNPVSVSVPDRYNEGYADGESAVKAKIQSKSITANGTYYAADDGLDGFDPINVSVPDRYDEGYRDGYDDGYSLAESYYTNVIDPDKPYLIVVTMRELSIRPGRNQLYVQYFPDKSNLSLIYEEQFWNCGTTEASYNARITKIEWKNRGNGTYELYISLVGYNSDGSESYTSIHYGQYPWRIGMTPNNTSVINALPT